MREQDRPLVADPVVKPDLPFGRFGGEIGRFVTDAYCHVALHRVAGPGYRRGTFIPGRGWDSVERRGTMSIAPSSCERRCALLLARDRDSPKGQLHSVDGSIDSALRALRRRALCCHDESGFDGGRLRDPHESVLPRSSNTTETCVSTTRLTTRPATHSLIELVMPISTSTRRCAQASMRPRHACLTFPLPQGQRSLPGFFEAELPCATAARFAATGAAIAGGFLRWIGRVAVRGETASHSTSSPFCVERAPRNGITP